jgi:hypothetical protein
MITKRGWKMRDDTNRPYANYTSDEIKGVCAMWAKTKDSEDEELAKRSRLCIRNAQAEIAMRHKQ